MKYSGLTDQKAISLRKKFGENILPTKEQESVFFIFLSQFKSPLIYVLIAVAVISLFLKEYFDASLMGIVILFNAIMGFFQEYKTRKTLKSLRKILKPQAFVIRNGKNKKIEAKDIVPGDYILLGSGDRIPADGKIIEGINLIVSEAVLTGESEAVNKSADVENDIVFMGTTVLSGRGIMIAEKTGVKTEMGKIGKSLSEIKEEKTPLQEKLAKMAVNLTLMVIIVCVLIFTVGILYRRDFWEMLETSLVLSIAAIPEGLPIAITIILALGMSRIYKRKGLVKKLLAMETLGVTSVVCSDKTGTITEGVMRVVNSEFIDQKKAMLSLTLNNSQKSNLEIAIWEFIKQQNLFDPDKIYHSNEKINEEPFSSEKKYAFSIVNFEGKNQAFITGGPEIILAMCKLPESEKVLYTKKIESWAKKGLRIMGIACKEEGNFLEKKDMNFLGLLGIEDPIRPGVKRVIKEALDAGIKVKIVTGDYSKTAESIAKELGFKLKKENILEGKDLETISEFELKKRIDKIILFTRVTPHQKLKIVKALQSSGEIVAMTGDGVNDAPALLKADIGVAVSAATDVAKDASDLILLDNNFKTIISACEEGRLIFSNIKKVVGYVLSNSFAEIILIFCAMLFNLPTPLTIIQILYIHLICDGPPDIALGFETNHLALKEEDPKKLRKEEILGKEMRFLIFVISLTVGVFALALFKFYLDKTNDLVLSRTIAFASIASVSLIYIFSFKDLKKSLFKTENIFKNKFLLLSVLYGFILVFCAVYIPAFNKILGTEPLGLYHWLWIFAVGFAAMFWVELIKYFLIRKNRKNI